MTKPPEYAWAHWRGELSPDYMLDGIVQKHAKGWLAVCDLNNALSPNYRNYQVNPLNDYLSVWRITPLVPL